MTVPSTPTKKTAGTSTASLAGRQVHRIGFGALQLGYDTIDRADSIALLRRAVELGVDHFDTAEFYGPPNGLIRAALSPYPDDLVLAIKVGAVADPEAVLVAAQRPEQLRTAVEDNLRSLGIERLGVVNLRRTDAPPGIIAEGDQRVDMDSQLAELILLREQGKIGAIGLSNVDHDQLRAAIPADIACVQNYYSLLRRDDQPVLDLCGEQQIAYVPYFPLGSGHAGMPRVTEHPEVIKVAARIGATPAQVGLAWLLHQDPHILLIPGTTSIAHLEENVAAADLELDDEAMMVLDRATASPDSLAAEDHLLDATS